jgi:hypothetical protein
VIKSHHEGRSRTKRRTGVSPVSNSFEPERKMETGRMHAPHRSPCQTAPFPMSCRSTAEADRSTLKLPNSLTHKLLHQVIPLNPAKSHYKKIPICTCHPAELANIKYYQTNPFFNSSIGPANKGDSAQKSLNPHKKTNPFWRWLHRHLPKLLNSQTHKPPLPRHSTLNPSTSTYKPLGPITDCGLSAC